MRDLDYLKLLAKQFPTATAAGAEIINLRAICALPKGTEYFFSDLHGESDAFIYLMRSASGIVRDKIDETFGNLLPEDVDEREFKRGLEDVIRNVKMSSLNTKIANETDPRQLSALFQQQSALQGLHID